MKKFIVYLHIEYDGIVRETRHEIVANSIGDAEKIGKELKKFFGAFRYVVIEETLLFDSMKY